MVMLNWIFKMVILSVAKAETRIPRITGGFPRAEGFRRQLPESSRTDEPRVPTPGLTQVPAYSFSEKLCCLYH